MVQHPVQHIRRRILAFCPRRACSRRIALCILVSGPASASDISHYQTCIEAWNGRTSPGLGRRIFGAPSSAATRAERKPSTSVEHGGATTVGRDSTTTPSHLVGTAGVSAVARCRRRSAFAAAAGLDRVSTGSGAPA
jgi:hypothetical protein